jgi:hypothetical protein
MKTSSTIRAVKFRILIFSATGTKIKNSPSYINKNRMINVKFILYWIFILFKDLKPHS